MRVMRPFKRHVDQCDRCGQAVKVAKSDDPATLCDEGRKLYEAEGRKVRNARDYGRCRCGGILHGKNPDGDLDKLCPEGKRLWKLFEDEPAGRMLEQRNATSQQAASPTVCFLCDPGPARPATLWATFTGGHYKGNSGAICEACAKKWVQYVGSTRPYAGRENSNARPEDLKVGMRVAAPGTSAEFGVVRKVDGYMITVEWSGGATSTLGAVTLVPAGKGYAQEDVGVQSLRKNATSLPIIKKRLEDCRRVALQYRDQARAAKRAGDGEKEDHFETLAEQHAQAVRDLEAELAEEEKLQNAGDKRRECKVCGHKLSQHDPSPFDVFKTGPRVCAVIGCECILKGSARGEEKENAVDGARSVREDSVVTDSSGIHRGRVTAVLGNTATVRWDDVGDAAADVRDLRNAVLGNSKACPSCGAPMVVIHPEKPGLIERRCIACGEETRGEEGLREYENASDDYAWRCQECGHKFASAAAAERAASSDRGSPKCGGSDVDESLPIKNAVQSSLGFQQPMKTTTAKNTDPSPSSVCSKCKHFMANHGPDGCKVIWCDCGEAKK